MMLSLTDVSFSYGAVPILENVNLRVEKGECVAVLGTNGAGKSTMLRCIDRILRHNAGVIEAGGKNIETMKPDELARKVGYVPQKLSFAQCTVFDAVLLGRRPYIRWDVSENDIKITERVLERLSLSALVLRDVTALSGGEQQKVALARALVQEPDVLLFDEPTSNLDVKNQMEVVMLIRELARERAFSVIVTMHDLNLALRFADRFVLMKDRTIAAVGGREIITPENIKSVYGMDALVETVAGHTVVIPL